MKDAGKVGLALEAMFAKYGDFLVQFQGKEVKSGRVKYTEWKKDFTDGTVAWVPTDRQIFKDEFIIELDPENTEDAETFAARANKCEGLLLKNKISYARYHSGNKSWHFHTFIDDLGRREPAEKRKKIRELLAEKLFSEIKPWDINLFNETHLIRISGAINPKSGKPKCINSEKFFEEPFFIPPEIVAEINRLEAPNRPEQVTAEEKPKVEDTNCMLYACDNKLPIGNRQNKHGKNFMACSNWGEHIDKFVKAQLDPSFKKEGLIDWTKFEKNKGKPLTFNCFEERILLREEGISNVCLGCKYFKNNYGSPEVFEEEETDYGKLHVRKSSTPVSLSLVAEQITEDEINGGISGRKIYDISRFFFGVGTREKFIITTPDEPNYLSGNKVYLAVASKKKVELFQSRPISRLHLGRMLGYRKVPYEETDENLLSKVISLQSTDQRLIYEATAGVPEEEIINLDNETCHKIVRDFITMGFNVDPIIQIDFLSDILLPNNKLIVPESYMQYNPHGLTFTFNTGVGKSRIAGRTSKRLDKATAYGLIGGGTADRIKKGELENNIYAVRIDEMQEDSDVDAKGNILSIMDLGYAVIAQGMKDGTRINSWSSLHFMGNPKTTATETDIGKTLYDYQGLELLTRFEGTLSKISTNYGALGRRLGFILFMDNISPVTGSGFDLPKQDILFSLVDGLRRLTSDNYSRLFLDSEIIAWLDKGYDPEFLAKIDEAAMVCKFRSIKEFLVEYKKSYRHLRGKALKIACTYFMHDLGTGELDKKELFKKANECLKDLQKICIGSIYMIVNVSSAENYSDILSIKISGLPLHLKCLAAAAIMSSKVNKGAMRISYIELEENLIKVVKYYKATYGIQALKKRILTNIETANNKLENIGIRVIKDNEDDLIVISEDITDLAKLLEKDCCMVAENEMVNLAEGDPVVG